MDKDARVARIFALISMKLGTQELLVMMHKLYLLAKVISLRVVCGNPHQRCKNARIGPILMKLGTHNCLVHIHYLNKVISVFSVSLFESFESKTENR